MNARRRDIDWLRVLAMLAVFVFHCTRFFDTEGWHLKNAEQSYVLFVLVRGLMWPWLMELFFLLSGVGAWYVLHTRSAGAFLADRTKRLLVPLYTVGLLALLPPQFCFEIASNQGYTGAFGETVARYFAAFDWPRLTLWPNTLVPVPFCGHLWFLQFLFLVSLAALPLLIFLKSPRGLRWIDRLARLFSRPGGVFAPAIPLAVALVVLRALFAADRGWAEFVWYAIYFVLGYMIPADDRFTTAFMRHQRPALAVWLAGMFGGILTLVLVFGYDPMPGQEPFSLLFVLFQVIWSLASVGSVVFILSLGARYLDFGGRKLAHANEAVLPFYLFHQTIILVVGYFVIRWNISVLPKFLVIVALSLAAIMALYELLVRPFNPVRFLFGMRPKRP